MSSPFPSFWIRGSVRCAANTDPPFQVHALDRHTIILRQNKCTNFEAPFLYLLIGSEKALLLDTGAEPHPGQPFPLRTLVDDLIRQATPNGVPLIVAHSHAHSDHVFGDAQFLGRPETTVVQPTLDHVRDFFGLVDWPEGSAAFDLGGRLLRILPIPGHEASHIALHDERTGILLTGDTLYPGLLIINDWPAYRLSAHRLERFTGGLTISYVLGAHIEMKREPGHLFPIGSTYQPDEHELSLGVSHLKLWSDTVSKMGESPHEMILPDFILEHEPS